MDITNFNCFYFNLSDFSVSSYFEQLQDVTMFSNEGTELTSCDMIYWQDIPLVIPTNLW
jgi:hypothetical protein